MKNENATLKQRLEELGPQLQNLEDKRREERVTRTDREEDMKVERGVQGSDYCRGEGEGRVRITEEKERRGEIMGSHREAGVGEEVLRVQGGKGETCDEEVESSRRGEAEGGQKDREKQGKERGKETEQTGVTTSSKHLKSIKDNAEVVAADQTVCPPSGPDVELLTNRLREAQQEADRQAMVGQDLRSKLGEQSKRAWEAEQRLVVLEAELQLLKKATESLGDARRQIEVGKQEDDVIETHIHEGVVKNTK